ncbi:MAG: RNA-protein complex protein Nop10 [Thermofilaceae archaeon]|nr:RNA-protein complex protein Nop10 [Thermofilaceae archaeon]MCX8181060.1 RNA-protein complex protein Nop10 [Thermofilaceae archaeon]MDW8004541.1 RNA-protein complex protein Nop10 [Thermofilaceae archaeon]
MVSRWLLRKCKACGVYTFKNKCPSCKSEVHIPHPPKFSPEDKYGKYRRMMKKNLQNST